LYNISSHELSGVADILNSSGDSTFCAFLVEQEEGRVKGSLRSDPTKGVDVSRIARALGGGGHKYASGFSFHGQLQEAEEVLVDAVNMCRESAKI
jgi:bifunctional oligoribonuclease and PAP phosphatase NrnA